MSYRHALGQSGIRGILQSASEIINDPYLPEITCQIQSLSSMQKGGKALRCARQPKGLKGGIGMEVAIKPLRAFVFYTKNPWVVRAVVMAVLGVTFYAGYATAKSRKKTT